MVESIDLEVFVFFEEIRKDYLAYLTHERGASRATVDCYSAWLNHYIRWCDGQNIGVSFLERFNAHLLRRYLYHQSERGLRPRTIRNAFAPLRGLGAYAIDHNIVKEDASRLVRLPKKDAAERPLIGDAELASLLSACDRIAESRRAALARAMLSTLIYTGVRFSECLDLKVTDLDLKTRTLVVRHGKGEKSRTLHLCDECLVSISEWMLERAKIGAKADWLWQYDTRRRMGELGTRQLIQDVVYIAGLQDHPGAKPHSIRHAFATRMLRNGADLTAISASLGHQSLNTTWVYLHASETPAKAMEQYASLQTVAPAASVNGSIPHAVPSPPQPTRADHHLRQRRRLSAK